MRRSSRQEQEWRLGWDPVESGPVAPEPSGRPEDAAPPASFPGPGALLPGWPGDPVGRPAGEDTAEIGIARPGPAGAAPQTGTSAAIRFVAPPGPPPVKSAFARAWTVPQPEPSDAREMVVRFRRAAVSLAMSLDEGTASGDHAREGASALVALASIGQEELLSPVLRADPERDDVTWTVACYQIGDLSPTTLRDFADASSAVRNLAGCGEAAHVAAELIVTNGDGIRWTALVRSGADVTFQLLAPGTASAGAPAVLQRARHRWEDQLLDWAARPAAGLSATAEPAAPAPAPVPAPLTPPGSGEAVAVGMALGQLLESVRRIEERLPAVTPGDRSPGPVIGALAGRPPASSDSSPGTDRRVARLEQEVEDLKRELAASARRLAALEAALGRSMGHPDGSGAEGLVLSAGSVGSSPGRPDAPDGAIWLR